jgi:hypothetical protein
MFRAVALTLRAGLHSQPLMNNALFAGAMLAPVEKNQNTDL